MTGTRAVKAGEGEYGIWYCTRPKNEDAPPLPIGHEHVQYISFEDGKFVNHGQAASDDSNGEEPTPKPRRRNILSQAVVKSLGLGGTQRQYREDDHRAKLLLAKADTPKRRERMTVAEKQATGRPG
jgi:hypothetical protein